jgi:hypothetical protein
MTAVWPRARTPKARAQSRTLPRTELRVAAPMRSNVQASGGCQSLCPCGDYGLTKENEAKEKSGDSETKE